MRDCGGSGPTLMLVPSLINPPTILDLDPDCSLAEALATQHRVLLLDWGPAAERQRPQPRRPCRRAARPADRGRRARTSWSAIASAAPWRWPQRLTCAKVGGGRDPRFALSFRGLCRSGARAACRSCGERARRRRGSLGFLPMEVLQAAFWQIDPARLVAKFARFAGFADPSPEARRFVDAGRLGEWRRAASPSCRAPAGRAAVRTGRHARAPALLPDAACHRLWRPDRPRRHGRAGRTSVLPLRPRRHDRRPRCADPPPRAPAVMA